MRNLLCAATALTAVAIAAPALANATLSGTLTTQQDLDSLSPGGGAILVNAGTNLVGLGTTSPTSLGSTINGVSTLIPIRFALFSLGGVTASPTSPVFNVTNAGFIAGDLTNAGATSLTAAGTSGGIQVGAGSTVANQTGGVIAGTSFGIFAGQGAATGFIPQPTIVVNNGTIITYLGQTSPFGFTGGGVGIVLSQSGSVTNTGAIITGGSGTLTAGSTAPTAGLGNGTGISVGGSATQPAGSITNSGTILGAVGVGTFNSSGGTVTNAASGIITANITGTRSAVVVSGLNAIISAPTGGLIAIQQGGGTVINSGTITGLSNIGVTAATVTNNQGGTINPTGTFAFNPIVTGAPLDRTIGDGVYLIGLPPAGSNLNPHSSLTNAGTIRGAVNGVYIGQAITTNASATNPSGTFLAFGAASIGDVTNSATGHITGGQVGVSGNDDGFLANLTNSGIIDSTNGVGVFAGGEFGVGTNGATILAPVINNSGQIIGGNAAFTQAFSATTLASIVNSDGAPPFGAGIIIGDYGLDAGASPTINNAAGGVIRGGTTGVAAASREFVNATNPNAVNYANVKSDLVVNNSGEISASTAGTGVFAAGNATITNNATGVITGKAFQTSVGLETLGVWTFGRGTVSNAGTINGHVKLEFAGSSLSNSGTINFAVAGAPMGTSTIAGNFTNTANGKLVFKIAEDNSSDKINITGKATLQGGTVSVAAPDGKWDVSHNYTILTATGGVTGTFSAANANLDFLTPSLSYSANAVILSVGRRTEVIQETVVTQTAQQQVSTSARQTAAAVDARVDQAISSAFNSLPGFNQSPNSSSSQKTSFELGGMSGVNAGDATSGNWGSWATFSPTFTKQSLVLPGQTSAQGVTGTSYSFLAGVDRIVTSRLIAGAFFSYESSNFDISSSSGTRTGHGPVLGTYVGALLTDWAYASAQTNYAWISNGLNESTFGSAPVKGSFDSRRFMFSSTLTARKTTSAAILSAKAAYSYTRENFDTYTASDNTPVSPGHTRLGRITIGGEALGSAEKFKMFVPYASVNYEWDIDTNAKGPKNGAVFGTGVRYLRNALSVDFYGSAQAFRAGQRSYSLGLNARYAF